MRAMRFAVWIAATLALLRAPSSAQLTAPEPTALFPSWSEQVQSLGIGSVSLTSQGSELRTSRKRCTTASAVGFSLGAVGSLIWSDPIRELADELPGSRIQTPLGNRTLADVGALFAKGLVCPSPLARFDWARPTSPAPTGPVR